MKQPTQKHRLQFDFFPEEIQSLDDLKIKTNTSTRVEVVRRAIRFYKWFANKVNPSYVIEIKDSEGNLIYRTTADTLLF